MEAAQCQRAPLVCALSALAAAGAYRALLRLQLAHTACSACQLPEGAGAPRPGQRSAAPIPAREAGTDDNGPGNVQLAASQLAARRARSGGAAVDPRPVLAFKRTLHAAPQLAK